jgi:hypothetical protein
MAFTQKYTIRKILNIYNKSIDQRLQS